MAIERSDAALRAVESVEAVGGKALWRSANLLDGAGDHGHRRGDPQGARPDRRPGPRRRHRDQPEAVREGGQGVRPRLRHQGRRLLQPAEGRGGHADRGDGRLQLRGRPLRQRGPDRLQRGEQPALRDVERAAARRGPRPARSRSTGRPGAASAWPPAGRSRTIMAAAGISMLPPESGIPTVRRELVAGGGSGELVVAGTLGIMGAEYDPTGGLDVEKAQAELAGRKRPLLMVGQREGRAALRRPVRRDDARPEGAALPLRPPDRRRPRPARRHGHRGLRRGGERPLPRLPRGGDRGRVVPAAVQVLPQPAGHAAPARGRVAGRGGGDRGERRAALGRPAEAGAAGAGARPLQGAGADAPRGRRRSRRSRSRSPRRRRSASAASRSTRCTSTAPPTR